MLAPEHAGLFQAASRDGLAASFDHSAADEVVMGSILLCHAIFAVYLIRFAHLRNLPVFLGNGGGGPASPEGVFWVVVLGAGKFN